MSKFCEGDKVYDITTDQTGVINTVYPEVNMAIVNFNGNVRKVLFDDLAPVYAEPIIEDDQKRKTLLDKVRGVFR